MSPPPERVPPGTPDEWLRHGQSDLALARLGRGSGDILPGQICFHAQQAAEKYLKAFLCFNDVIPPRTHSIEQLLELCAELNERFSDLVAETAFLTDYAAELRYDIGFWPDKSEAEAASEAADRIRRLVLSILPEDIHP